MYHILDDRWDRKKHFVFFQSRANPRLCVSCTVSVKKWLDFRKEKILLNLRFTDYVYYSAMLAANSIKEFRQRIVDLQPVEFEKIDSAFTHIPSTSKLHCNCFSKFDENFILFKDNLQAARDQAESKPTLTPEGGNGQNLIYLSCLNKISFHSLTNPWGDPWSDSVPRIIFGKFNEDGLMPVSIEVLHSFIDGLHLSAFIDHFQTTLNSPDINIRVSTL